MIAISPRKLARLPFVVDVEADALTLPLFSWFGPPKKSGRPSRATVIVKHCRDCGTIINRSSRGRCKPCANVGLKRACPADLLLILRTYGSHGAAKHYHASLATVTRWRRELELTPQARMKKGIGQSRQRGFIARPLITVRDTSIAGQAVDYLRRYGSVYRCDQFGKPDPRGSHWKRNFTILTDDEIIARARRLGWAGWEF